MKYANGKTEGKPLADLAALASLRKASGKPRWASLLALDQDIRTNDQCCGKALGKPQEGLQKVRNAVQKARPGGNLRRAGKP